MNSAMIGRPMDILLVEDSLTQAHLTYFALKEANFEHRLSVVLDGQEAYDFLFKIGKYRRVPDPDLVLLDLRLPKKDGLELLAEIKTAESLQAIPIVVLTSSESEQDRKVCESLKVDAFLKKPVDVRAFLDVVRQLRDYWERGELILPTL